MIQINDTEFGLLKDYLSTACGIEVPADKSYLFVTRLSDFLGEIGCSTFSEFYIRLGREQGLNLRNRLVEAMTTNETAFFRDGHPFHTLVETILPELGEQRVSETKYTRPRLRIASVGCATGEEAYTIAMCVYDWLDREKRFTRNDIAIVAVDISRTAIEHARRATYSVSRLRGKLPDRYVKAYFRESPAGGLVVREDVRAMVSFGELNLAEPLEHLGAFDLIFCRNVVIYFSYDLKKRILEQFHRMMRLSGVLIMGASEGLYKLSESFRVVHAGPTTYYRKEA